MRSAGVRAVLGRVVVMGGGRRHSGAAGGCRWGRSTTWRRRRSWATRSESIPRIRVWRRPSVRVEADIDAAAAAAAGRCGEEGGRRAEAGAAERHLVAGMHPLPGTPSPDPFIHVSTYFSRSLCLCIHFSLLISPSLHAPTRASPRSVVESPPRCACVRLPLCPNSAS